MYKHRGRAEYQKILNVPDNYIVDGFIATGTHPKSKEYPNIYSALDMLGLEYHEEKIENRFFGDIKSFKFGNRRIWFDVVYGAAYLSEVEHVACLFGSQKNILLGTCGALTNHLNSGDTIIPASSFGDESSTRMYQRDNSTFVYKSDPVLRSMIKSFLPAREIVDDGRMVTVQSMLAETKDDVERWANEGYAAVDMESATFFAVADHFGVPSAALLLVADNLIRNELVNGVGYELMREQRTVIKRENYETALKVLLN